MASSSGSGARGFGQPGERVADPPVNETISFDELEDDADYRLATTSGASLAAAAQHRELMATLDERALARRMAVPTNDGQVRQRLRAMREPITLFGEREVDRRERLRDLLTKERIRRREAGGSEAGEEGSAAASGDEDEEGEEEEEEEEFYTEGTQALLSARQRIARFSLQRAAQRLRTQRQAAQSSLRDIVTHRKAVFAPLLSPSFTNLGSQIGDERPVSVVRFAPNARTLLTASWGGMIRRWAVPSASEVRAFRAHADKVAGLAWHPAATLGQPESGAVNFASGGADGKVCLWSLEESKPLRTMLGHVGRVCRTAFHPMGQHLATAGFDGTWRLWDVDRAEEILLQEGHSKEVYAVEFQDDGALVASGGLDAIGRVWDCRTGKSCMVLAGHAKEILSIDFSPNGYQLATASGDDTVRIWDLRALKDIYTIPAHTSSVADVRFFRAAADRRAMAEAALAAGGAANDIKREADSMDVDTHHDHEPSSAGSVKQEGAAADPPGLSSSGLYLATAGYDGLLKVWSADDWQLMRSFKGDAGKVMSVDISSDGQYLASGEWARTFKLWGTL